jgi:CubicO group peptidase (beta-lactamase class C family)
MALGTPLAEFVGAIQPEFEPGSRNRYNSADTQALGMLLSAATGTSITRYMQEVLWHPLGMESDGFWIIDDDNVELAFAGLNATARDYAKLGELFRLQGRWHGKTLLPARWVRHSITPDAPHLLPNVNEDFPLGYGYQWWVIDSTEGEYAAIGVYNQFIYVNPERNLVIVKLSANSDYGVKEAQSSYRELETIEMFRAIGRSIAPGPGG